MTDLDFDKELAVCEALETDSGMAEETCLTKAESRFMRHAEVGYPEALRRLKRLRELVDDGSIRVMSWRDSVRKEIRDLLNIKEN